MTHTGAMADVAGVEQRWAAVRRWGPYAMLGVGTVLTTATMDIIGMSTAERYATVVLVTAVLLWQLWWDRWFTRTRAGRTPVSACYYLVRAAAAFVLSWLNPFFAFLAAVGYFDADRLLPPRLLKTGLLVTAVTVAGSQSGGFPPRGPLGWGVFGALLCVHLGMIAVFGHLTAREDERTRTQAATIAELERTNTALQQALDENAALHTQLLVQAREAGVADERRRLAAEIHDTLAQGLTGIIAQLQVAASAQDPALSRTHMDRALTLARDSLGEARRSVHNLSPVALADDKLPEALRKTVTEWGERTDVRARFTVTGTAEPLHDEVAATLLRIVQEALSNAARHAAATRVGVTLSYMGDEVSVDIRDDGRGFDPLAVPARTLPPARPRPSGGTPTGGFGLDGMRARAERIAGSLAIESEPGAGTAVSARVPLVRHDR
ncbi:sensor histidine kinase [Streptomyces marokkonensis]|uniref:sensor histidine kinase n=1 Tax=Streptomyces marokkonensis TaxID=324855 RepID=UPI001FCC1120|nr:sensor histidine kinase [Streptomyces marokkonensis]